MSWVVPAIGGSESAPEGPVTSVIIRNAADVGPVTPPVGPVLKNALNAVTSVRLINFCVLTGEKT